MFAYVECVWEVDVYKGDAAIFGAGLKVSRIIFGINRKYSKFVDWEICAALPVLEGDSRYTGEGFLQHSGDCCLTVSACSEEAD
jgi:hypothetical protein